MSVSDFIVIFLSQLTQLVVCSPCTEGWVLSSGFGLIPEFWPFAPCHAPTFSIPISCIPLSCPIQIKAKISSNAKKWKCVENQQL